MVEEQVKIRLDLDKEYIEKHWFEAQEKADEGLGLGSDENEKQDTLIFETEGEIVSLETPSESVENMAINIESPVGYIDLGGIPLDSEDLGHLVQHIVKKLNKFRTVMEGLK